MVSVGVETEMPPTSWPDYRASDRCWRRVQCFEARRTNAEETLDIPGQIVPSKSPTFRTGIQRVQGAYGDLSVQG